MEPETEVMFGVRKREHPSEPLIQARGWFPTLKQMSSKKIAGILIQAINNESDEKCPWTKLDWISAKVYLHRQLPTVLRKDLHDNYIICNGDGLNCDYCANILRNAWPRLKKPSDDKLIFAEWLLLHEFDKPDFVKSSLQIDLSVLSQAKFYVSVTSIKFSNENLDLATLDSCLRRLVDLDEVRYDYAQEGDGEEFQLLKKYCRLKKFEFRRFRKVKFQPKMVMNLLDFLWSQSGCLQELNLQQPLVWFKTDEILLIWIWNVVAGLRELTVLHLNTKDVTRIDVATLPPCKYVKTLVVNIVCKWEFGHGFPFKQLFPLVENVYMASNGADEGDLDWVLEPGEIFQSTTYLTSVIAVNPFWLMKYMPMVKQLYLSCEEGYSYFEVNLPYLTDLGLNLKYYDPLNFEHFKSLFGSFPNLITFELYITGLDNFDEKNFINFLPGVTQKITNLKKLNLDIENHPEEMTGATVCAFLRNSNLEMFEDFCKFKFSHRDFAELKCLADEKNLIVLRANKRSVFANVFFTPCDNGKHELFLGFPRKKISGYELDSDYYSD